MFGRTVGNDDDRNRRINQPPTREHFDAIGILERLIHHEFSLSSQQLSGPLTARSVGTGGRLSSTNCYSATALASGTTVATIRSSAVATGATDRQCSGIAVCTTGATITSATTVSTIAASATATTDRSSATYRRCVRVTAVSTGSAVPGTVTVSAGTTFAADVGA